MLEYLDCFWFFSIINNNAVIIFAHNYVEISAISIGIYLGIILSNGKYFKASIL